MEGNSKGARYSISRHTLFYELLYKKTGCVGFKKWLNYMWSVMCVGECSKYSTNQGVSRYIVCVEEKVLRMLNLRKLHGPNMRTQGIKYEWRGYEENQIWFFRQSCLLFYGYSCSDLGGILFDRSIWYNTVYVRKYE